jgi:hypothetical protein
MYVVAMVHRAMASAGAANQTDAATARALAWKHFAALEFLHNVTGSSNGFIARTAVKCSEPHQHGDGTICNKSTPNTCGWVNSTVCYTGVDDLDSAPTGGDGGPEDGSVSKCCWTYKRDTSSDEVMGHVWAFTAVHQLLAKTAAEKRRVARSLCKAVKYIVDGGDDFIDPTTGRRTTWGYWDSTKLNGIPGAMDERGGNALELLAFLAAANKICPVAEYSQPENATFGGHFVDRIRNHQYVT